MEEAVGGKRGNIQVDGGMWGTTGVFGPTEGVAVDGGGKTSLYTGQNLSLSSLFYFEHPNCPLLTNCGRVGCLGGGWIPLRICIS